MKKTHWLALLLALGLLVPCFPLPGRELAQPVSADLTGLPGQGLNAASAGGGPIGSDFQISNVSVDAMHPAVAYNSEREEYLVVWYNDRAGNDDIYGQRVSKNGMLVGPWFAISAGAGADRRYPDVAYNSKQNEYLVVWEHDDGIRFNIRGRRVSATGQVQGGEITLGTGPALRDRSKPAVAYAYTSDKYLVVWQSHVWMFIASDIEGQVLSSLGALEGSNFLIAQGTWSASHEQPDLAYNRSRNEYLVVWRREDNTGASDIYGQRVKMAGGVGTSGPSFAIASQSGAVVGQVLRPAVAAIPKPSNVGQHLVVWERIFSPGDRDILGQRVKGDDGSLQGSFVDITSLGSEDTFNPAVAACENSEQYLVAWTLPWGSANSNIHGRAVSTQGNLLGEETFLGGGVSGWVADNAAVATGWLGDFLVAYDDQPLWTLSRDIYGQLWGNRVYLPMVLKNYQ